jgi:hypothetical protein
MHIVLVGEPEGKIPLERTRRRRENNIRVCLRGMRTVIAQSV